MSKIHVLFFFLTIACLNACKLPFDDTDLNVKLTPEYAVPLVETEKNMRDLFRGFDGDAYLQVQADGTFKMFYKSQVLETQPFNLFAGLPDVTTIPVLGAYMSKPFPSPSNTRIDAIDFKNGYFFWRFDAQTTPLTVTVSVPQFTKNGQTFSKTFTLGNTAYRDSISLKDWHCEPTLGNIVIMYEAKKASGEFVSLDNQGAYDITRFEARTMIGYFGQFLVALPRDTITLDFFKNWRANGKIAYSEPKMTYSFENGYGFPVQARTSTAESINQSGQKVALQSPLTSGINLPFPSLNEIGGSKSFSQVVDSKNSNISTVFESNPTAIAESFIGITNLNNTAKAAGFFTEAGRLKVSYTLEVPIVGTARDFVALDTLALDLSKFSEATAAEFKLTTDNGMPIDMNVQAYFISSTGSIIDSLVDKQPLILRGAPATATGTTIGSTLNYHFVKLDAAKFTNIRATKRVIVKYTVSSTNNGANPVRINANQYMSFKLGVRVGVNL